MPILNDEQKQAVYEDENAVVIAGAGGGKTTVLASRVLRLLIDKQISLSKILLLTFTNKASAEMSDRLYALLEHTIASEEFLEATLSDAQRKVLLQEREHFQQAKIMTLDAFCLRIAQIGMSRLGATQTLKIEENLEPAIEQFAAQWLLAHPESELKSLLRYYTFSSLVHNIICPLLQDCSCFSIDLEGQLAHILEASKQAIGILQAEILEDIAETNELFSNIEAKSATASVKRLLTEIASLETIVKKELTKLCNADDVNFSLNGVTKSNQVKPIAEQVKQIVALLKAKYAQVKVFARTLVYKEHYKKYYKAMQTLVDDWNAHRKQLGLYSYSNIAEIARYTLEQYDDIRTWYGNTYSHIIIDEFQDNSLDQKHLLYLLSGCKPYTQASELDQEVNEELTIELGDNVSRNNTYFFVGDPKQSIYGFRGADIQAFLSLKQDNKQLSMLTNYRSSAPLIDLLNQWFSKLFADENINEELQISEVRNVSVEAQASEAITFDMQLAPQNAAIREPRGTTTTINDEQEQTISAVLSLQEQDATKHLALQEVCCVFDLIHTVTQGGEQTRDTNKYNIEALLIAKRIRNMQKNGIALEDIAVLSRTKAIFPYIANHLIEMGIDYHIEENVASLRQDLGRDFFVWFNLLIVPKDKSIYAAVLRSPIAGLSDNMVVGLLAMHSELDADNMFTLPKDNSPLSAYLSKQITKSQELQEDLQILEALAQKYAEARNFLREGNLVAVLDHFWISCGYRIVLLRNTRYHVFLMQYYSLKALLLQHQAAGSVATLETLRAIVSGQAKSVESQFAKETKGVQIMTIHKSKGLEFPYVILASIHANIAKSGKDSAKVCKFMNKYYIDFANPSEQHHLLQAKGYEKVESLFSKKIQETGKKQISELLRILYVALTRAEKAIILSGYIPKKPIDTKKSPSTYFDWLNIHQCIPDFELEEVQTYSTNEQSLAILHKQNTLQAELDAQAHNNILAQRSTQKNSKQNASSELSNTINSIIDNATLLERVPRRQEVSPSNGTATTSHSSQYSNGNKEDTLPVLGIDAMLNTHNLHTAFGTYCHFLLSHYCRNTKLEALPLKLESQLLPLHSHELSKFIEESQALCTTFLQSPLWQNKGEHARVYTEYPFLLWNEIHRVHVRGIIDLIIIDEHGIHIVDYKVDKFKHPEKYQYQLATYRLAIQKLFAIEDDGIERDNNPIACNIYYLRSGEAVAHTFTMSEDMLIAHLLAQGENTIDKGELSISELEDNLEGTGTLEI